MSSAVLYYITNSRIRAHFCLNFQSVVDSSAQRLINLANQWEKHRAPLIEQFRTLKELSAKSEVGLQCLLKNNSYSTLKFLLH